VGHITRVYVPVEALRVDQPSYGGIRSYWLCFEHAELPENDPVLTGALARRI